MMIVYRVLLITLTLALIVSASDDCGDGPAYNDLILFGNITDPGDWPWISALFYQDDTALKFVCGATLISRNAIITAAHCVRNERLRRTYPADTLVVVMGKHNIFKWRESSRVQSRHAEEVVIHPTYLESTNTGVDLVIIKFTNPIELTKYVKPICMWRNGLDQRLEGVRGTVVGWGMDEDGYSSTEEPRLTRLPLVSRQTCLDSHEDFRTFVYDNQLCAGNKDGSGPCHGDSGSGLYVRMTLPNGDRRWVLRGLVSRSLTHPETGLCDLRHYIVFTDLAKMASWVGDNTVAANTVEANDCVEQQNKKFQELGMAKVGNKYYYATSSRSLSWSDSQTFCRSHGLELATIESERENNQLAEYFRSSVPYFAGEGWWFWLGGTDQGHEGRWTWSSTGRNIVYNNWEPGQPDNWGGGENCLKMIVRRAGGQGWQDVPCNSGYVSWVCEMKEVC